MSKPARLDELVFVEYQMIRLKHLVLLLKQTPEGWPLPELIAEYNTIREFLSAVGESSEDRARVVVEEHGSEWIKGLR